MKKIVLIKIVVAFCYPYLGVLIFNTFNAQF